MTFRLTRSDKEVLAASARPETGGVAALTSWYFGIDPFPKQFAYVHAPQKRIVFLAAIRSGKTFGTALRAIYKCMTTPYYKFLNASISTDQAAVMYWLLVDLYSTSTRAKRWLDEEPIKRPFPKINFVNGASMDFRSVGYQAELLRTMEWDWINLDEAGWVNDYYTIQVLRGRTLGVRPNGIPREGAFSVTTSPTSVPWLRDEVEKGEPPTERHLTLRATIRDNPTLDPAAIDELYDEYDDALALIELEGQLPPLASTMFPEHVVAGCEDYLLNEELDMMVNEEAEGAIKVFHPRYGLLRWEMPYDPDGYYILSADLGTMDVPKRGSSAYVVLDVSKSPFTLAAWRWESGGGSWTPALETFKYLDRKYKPIERGVDTTGAQSILIDVLSSAGIDATGLRMNQVKDEMITESQLDMQGKKVKMPFIKELHRQITTYSLPDDKLVQDAAMAFFQALHLTRFFRPKKTKKVITKPLQQGRAKKRSKRRRGRTR